MTLGHVGEDFAPVQWLSEGWSALRRQAHDALTHFRGSDDDDDDAPSRWGLVATDIIDHADRVEVRMEVPGLKKSDLTVEVFAGQLRVTGEKQIDASRKEGDAMITERAFGRFQRGFSLPSNVQADAAKARYEEGVLSIDLPKSSAVERKEVEVH